MKRLVAAAALCIGLIFPITLNGTASAYNEYNTYLDCYMYWEGPPSASTGGHGWGYCNHAGWNQPNNMWVIMRLGMRCGKSWGDFGSTKWYYDPTWQTAGTGGTSHVYCPNTVYRYPIELRMYFKPLP